MNMHKSDMPSQRSTSEVTWKVGQGWWDVVWLVDHADSSKSHK